jgi:hypothetical protein
VAAPASLTPDDLGLAEFLSEPKDPASPDNVRVFAVTQLADLDHRFWSHWEARKLKCAAAQPTRTDHHAAYPSQHMPGGRHYVGLSAETPNYLVRHHLARELRADQITGGAESP